MTTRDLLALIWVLAVALAFYLNFERQKSELHAVKQQLWHHQAKSDLAAQFSLLNEKFRSAGWHLFVYSKTLWEKDDNGGTIVYSLDYSKFYENSDHTPPDVDRMMYSFETSLSQFRYDYRWEIKWEPQKTTGEGYGAFKVFASYSIRELD